MQNVLGGRGSKVHEDSRRGTEAPAPGGPPDRRELGPSGWEGTRGEGARAKALRSAQVWLVGETQSRFQPSTVVPGLGTVRDRKAGAPQPRGPEASGKGPGVGSTVLRFPAVERVPAVAGQGPEGAPAVGWEHEEQNQVPVGPWWQSPKPRGSDGDMIRARLLPQEARAGRPFSWGLEALPSE